MVAPKVDGPDYVEVVADGTKTYSTLLNELFALVDNARLSHKTIFEIDYGNDNKNLFALIVNSPSLLMFTMPYTDSTTNIVTVGLSENGSTYKESVNNTITNNSSQVPASGRKLVVYYDSATLDLATRASNCVYDNSNSGLNATEVQGAIDEVAGRIKSDTISGTTDQFGNINTSFAIDSRNIFSARYAMAGANGGVIPMIFAGGDHWYFKCVDWQLQNLANTSVSVKFYYFE